MFKNFKITTSNSDDPVAYYQQGGMCTGITRRMTGRIITAENDTSGLGRWSYMKIAGRDQRQ
eukprot:12904893-Ditylum_brightwellii.AAC.1